MPNELINEVDLSNQSMAMFVCQLLIVIYKL